MMWLHFICIMVVWNGNENEKTPKRVKMKRKKKWNDPKEGELRRKWDPYGEKIQKFTLGRLQMRSVFGYGRVSFRESPRTTVHCVIACKHLYHDCIWKNDLYYLSSVCLNILFKTKMTCLFCKFRIVNILNVWLNKENDNFDCFKFVWLGFLLVCIL